MRLILGKWNMEDPKVRERWGRRASSADLGFEGRGKHDHYSLELTRPRTWSMENLFNWAAGEIAHYRVFPPSRMIFGVDAPEGRVAEGATILQGVYVGPFRLRMADRVLEVFQGEDAKERWEGFTYGTLQGHAEKGIETFRVVWTTADGSLVRTGPLADPPLLPLGASRSEEGRDGSHGLYEKKTGGTRWTKLTSKRRKF